MEKVVFVGNKVASVGMVVCVWKGGAREEETEEGSWEQEGSGAPSVRMRGTGEG